MIPFHRDPDRYIWNWGACQNSWHKFRAVCCPQPACTHSGSGQIHPNPRYSQKIWHTPRKRYNLYFLLIVPIADLAGYTWNRGTVRIADINLELSAVHSRLVPIVDPDGYIWTWGTVRIADINFELAAVYSRLVPITGPDGNVWTRGTVRIMLT